MNSHKILAEIQKLFDRGIELGDLNKAAEAIDNEDTEKARKQFDDDVEKAFQELLTTKYEGNAEELARVLYKYFVKLSASGTNKRQSELTQTGKPGRPPKWGENGEYKLMIYEGVERELKKMKEEGIKSPKILAALKRMNPHTGKTRADKNKYETEIKVLQSTYSEAKSMLKND